MSDILADYREWAAEQPERISTHSDRCHMWPRHEACMIHRLAAALEAATLTDAERQAVEWFAAGDETLRGLLDRTKCRPAAGGRSA